MGNCQSCHRINFSLFCKSGPKNNQSPPFLLAPLAPVHPRKMSLDGPKNIPEYHHFPQYSRNHTDSLNRFVETEIEECLKSRTEQLSQFRDLGPPDLVQYRRVNGNREVIPVT